MGGVAAAAPAALMLVLMLLVVKLAAGAGIFVEGDVAGVDGGAAVRRAGNGFAVGVAKSEELRRNNDDLTIVTLSGFCYI